MVDTVVMVVMAEEDFVVSVDVVSLFTHLCFHLSSLSRIITNT
jgi:hypothetical protein